MMAAAATLVTGCAAATCVFAAVDRAAHIDAGVVLSRHSSLPLLFEPVGGSVSPRFLARSRNHALAISPDGVDVMPTSGAGVRMRFIHGDPLAKISGTGRMSVVHRLRGSAGDTTHTAAYERVRIANLHPGIDVAFRANGRELEYDVIVAPGAEPARFAFAIDGGETVETNDAGDLVIRLGAGTLVLRRPIAFQQTGDARRDVASRFVLAEGRVHIEVGEYDRSRPLVIDPVVTYATFLGGNNTEQGTAVAVDAAGNAYVTGYTQSSDFPLVNAYDRTIGKRADVEVFVSKLNAAGTGLVWSTYLGGSTGVDRAVGIAVDASGNVYVTGQTSGIDFPTTATAWQKGTAAGGFVAKLAPAGNALVYSTYILGATPSSIAVDASGNAYVAGSATSAFAATANAVQSISRNPTGSTAFLLKLNATGSAPVFATFLGGSGGDDATSLAIDAGGNAYVAGWTRSTDFPVRNAFQATKRSPMDGFVAKVASDGSQLVYATLLGGGLDDSVNAIAVDAEGNAFVAGETYSTDFPVKSGFQMVKAGHFLVNSSSGNAFVAKLSASGTTLAYGSFLGGEICQTYCQSLYGVPQIRADAAYGIAVDAAGHAYVTGIARSYTFPLVDSTSPRKQEDTDDSGFVAKLSTAGSTLLWSTFLRTGFNEPDNHWTRLPPGAMTGVAVDPSGSAVVTGDSDALSAFPATPGAFQTTTTGYASAIVAKFTPAQSLALQSSGTTVDTQTPVTLTATLAGPTMSGSVDFLSDGYWIGSAALVGNRATATLFIPVGIHAISAVTRGTGAASDSPALVLVVDVPVSCD
jgi:hypothetical protein